MKTSIDLLIKKAKILSQEQKSKMCGNKIKHNSFDDAEKKRIDYEKQHKWAMNSYKCPYCGFWHIGHAV